MAVRTVQNLVRGGLTVLIRAGKMVIMCREAWLVVRIRFMWKKPRSNSILHMSMVFTAVNSPLCSPGMSFFLWFHVHCSHGSLRGESLYCYFHWLPSVPWSYNKIKWNRPFQNKAANGSCSCGIRFKLSPGYNWIFVKQKDYINCC